MSPQSIRLGISTCPNDTFAFYGILTGQTDTHGLDFDLSLWDVQQLNDALFRGEFDVAKASFHAALLLADELGVLPSGSALGYGVGPLLLSSSEGMSPGELIESNGELRPPRVLCPGKHTTAALLYQLFHAGQGTVDHVIFSDIMPALQDGSADFGVCIHEGRFTWKEQGLGYVEDLGETWEKDTNTPLPLGGIVARKSLGDDVLRRVQAAIHDSLQFAHANRDATRDVMRQHAQELNDEVLFAHVDLYVNEWTTDLGSTGRSALQMLSEKAATAGVFADDAPKSLDVVGS